MSSVYKTIQGKTSDLCTKQSRSLVDTCFMAGLDDATTVEEAAAAVKQLRKECGWTAQQLAEKVVETARAAGDQISLTQQAVSFFENGHAKSLPRWIRYLELIYTGHRTNEREEMLASLRGDVVDVPMLDLAYGMGGTYLDEGEIEVRTEPFPLSFIRRYTKASPDKLVFAEGIGDSMAPTITSNDLLLIDRSQESLTMGDQIWACSFGGVGMVKRLRPRPDGSVAILSDNPNVPDDRAVDEELFLIGRVVAKVSKL